MVKTATAKGFVPGTKCTCPAGHILPKRRNGFGCHVVYETQDGVKYPLEFHGNGCCYTLRSDAQNHGLLGNRWKED